MTRILANVTSTITATLSLDGTPTDPAPDAATVTIVNSAGDTLYSGDADDDGTGVFSHDLTPTQLDSLTATWSFVFGDAVQQLQTHIEVVGGFLFTIAEARAVRPLQSTSDYSTSSILDMRTMVEDALEEYCGAFVPRYHEETLSTVKGRGLLLSKPYVRTIRSVTVDGAAYTTDQLATLSTDGMVLHNGPWATGYRNITVAYEHGRDQPSGRVKRAALLLCQTWLVDGPIDQRATSLNSGEGTYTLATPGLRGSYVGIPEVDATIQQHRLVTV